MSNDVLGDACDHCDVSLKERDVTLVMLLAGLAPRGGGVGLAPGTGEMLAPGPSSAFLEVVPTICPYTTLLSPRATSQHAIRYDSNYCF